MYEIINHVRNDHVSVSKYSNLYNRGMSGITNNTQITSIEI